MESSPIRKVAVAIDAVTDLYPHQPKKTEIQEVLDDPTYDLTFGVKLNQKYVDSFPGRTNTLYVIPKVELNSPENYTPLGYAKVDPTELIDPLHPSPLLSITLMGGESPGCHSGAFKDIVQWFHLPSTTAEELIIEIPYRTLFTGYDPEPEFNAAYIKSKSQNYPPDGAEVTFLDDKAVFHYKKTPLEP